MTVSDHVGGLASLSLPLTGGKSVFLSLFSPNLDAVGIVRIDTFLAMKSLPTSSGQLGRKYCISFGSVHSGENRWPHGMSQIHEVDCGFLNFRNEQKGFTVSPLE